MIKLLKRKFVAVSMLSSGVTLLIILIVVNGLSYHNMIRKLDDSLIMITTRPIVNDIGNKQMLPDPIRGRSFSVELSPSSSVTNVDVNLYPIMDQNQAIDLAKAAITTKTEKGFLQDFRFLITDKDNGKLVTFIDSRFELSTRNQTLITSLFVYIIGMGGILILVLAFSKPAIKPIQESYEKQKRFMTDIMHEIKTPLTIIETDTEVIESDNGNSDWTKSIKNQISHLKNLLDELVTLLRMDESGIKLEKKEVNFSNLIEDTVSFFDPVFNQKNITLEEEIKKDIKVLGNEESLERLLSILLENSLKYTSGENKIKIMLKKQKQKCYLIVSNSVNNIETGKHQEFFDRFYRADASRNSATGGHGIGLSIAAEIVKQHKGTIEAYSTDDKNFTIKVLL